MTHYVPLDASVIGLLRTSPNHANVASCVAWLNRLGRGGIVVVLPDVTLYEVRRELIRISAITKLGRLQQLENALGREPISADAWLKAAEFWAIIRAAGKSTPTPSTATRSWRD